MTNYCWALLLLLTACNVKSYQPEPFPDPPPCSVALDKAFSTISDYYSEHTQLPTANEAEDLLITFNKGTCETSDLMIKVTQATNTEITLICDNCTTNTVSKALRKVPEASKDDFESRTTATMYGYSMTVDNGVVLKTTYYVWD